MFKILLSVLFSLAITCTFAQVKESTFHEVKPGETKYGIATEYGISMEDLEKFNPDIKLGLRPGMKLYIPKLDKVAKPADVKDTAKYIYVEVKPQQTLYSISKDYGLSYAEIKALNPDIEDGLREGQVLKLPKEAKVAAPKVFTPEKGYAYHTVEKGETAYSLSKDFGLSLDSLYLLNPDAKDALSIGQRLKYPSATKNTITQGLNTERTQASNQEEEYSLYKVKSGDTFFSLGKNFEVSKETLLSLNPELKDGGLQVDRYIIIPNNLEKRDTAWLNQLFSEVETEQNTRPAKVVKPKTTNKFNLDTLNIDYFTRHKVAILLPFFAPSSKDTAYSLDFDARSVVALDFYNGFLLAADSLTKAGMNLNLEVIDTRNSKAIVEEKINELQRTSPELIIGPLYKNHVERVARAFETAGVPVVSPLSNQVEVNGISNLIQCITHEEAFAASVAKILNQKEGAKHIVFTHTGIAKELELQKQIKARIAAVDNQISFGEIVMVTDNRKATISRSAVINTRREDKTNYYVCLSNNQVLLADMVNQLYKLRDKNINLIASSAIMDVNTLDYKYLNAINLIMPDDHNLEAVDDAVFGKKYADAYGMLPSKYALQGYDVGLYFLNKLWLYGPYMKESLAQQPQELNYTGFDFKKLEKGGYVNTFMFTTALKDYTLVRINN